MGLYSDDWERHASYLSYTRTDPLADSISFIKGFPFVLYRAPQLVLFTLSAIINNLLGEGVWGFIFVNFLLNYLIFIFIYLILSYLFKDRVLSLFSVFFIGSIFGRESTLYWGSTQPILLSVLLLLWLILLLVRRRDSLVVLFILTLLSVLSYEISVIIPFLILFYCYIERGVLDKDVISKVIITALAVFLTLCFKFYLFPKYIAPSNKDSYISEAVDISSLKEILNYPIKMFFDINPIVNYVKHVDTINLDDFLVSVTVLVFFYLVLSRGYNDTKFLLLNYINNKKLFYYGLFLFILSTLVIKVIGFNAGVIGKENRVLLIPVISYGFMLISLFLTINKRLFILISLIIMTSLNISILGTIRRVYIDSWGVQKEIFNNVRNSESVDFLVGDSTVIYLHNATDFLEYGVPVFDEYWTTTYFMRSAIGKSDIEAYYVNKPGRVNLKSQWTGGSIHIDRVVFYDVENNVFYKYNNE